MISCTISFSRILFILLDSTYWLKALSTSSPDYFIYLNYEPEILEIRQVEHDTK